MIGFVDRRDDGSWRRNPFKARDAI